MRKVLNNPNIKFYLLLGSILVCAMTWKAGEAVRSRLADQPVKQAPRVDRNAVPINAKSFYTVWVKQAAASPPQTDTPAAELDGLFQNKVEPKNEVVLPTEPDYAQMFTQVARINGVSKDGAFVNQRFYKVGVPMKELNFIGPMPIIEKIDSTGIHFRIGAKVIVFKTGVS